MLICIGLEFGVLLLRMTSPELRVFFYSALGWYIVSELLVTDWITVVTPAMVP